jgi:hypothetical protein
MKSILVQPNILEVSDSILSLNAGQLAKANSRISS